jgi:HAE1 family hydrophobic/amphiphilic exporter-1/multidrug efflux pump
MFSLFFINRPIFAKVISIFVVFVGFIALVTLPVEEYPEIAPPKISVVTSYTGGSASVVEESVTKPLEEQINGVEGMIYMESSSSGDGACRINIYFESGYDLDVAAIDVQNRVSVALPRLPDVVKQNGVRTVKSSSSMILILSVSSQNPKHDAMFLSNFASINIIDELKQVNGVGDVTNFGEKKYSMRIWLQPNKLATLKLTIPEIVSAIRSQNTNVALGTIGSQPSASSNMFQFSLTSKTRLSNVKEFEDIIIRQNPNGTQTKLKDVARIELGAENYGWYGKHNYKDTALLGISQIPGSNSLEVAKNIKKKIKELSSRFPKEIHVEPTYDTTKFVKLSIKEVIVTLIEALILVLLVVYFFLQSFRATIIPAIAIPVSLIGTFAILLTLGFTINTLTLFGLILAIGIVVDDAIIVVENVETNLQNDPNITPKEATTKAMKEIFTPIISTTLVLLAVFVPVTFIPGISGTLYQQFASTIAFAVSISSLVALTLSPALAGTILLRKDNSKKKFVVFDKFDKVLDSFKIKYELILEAIIKRWYVAITLFFIALASTYFMFNSLPKGFIPDEDKGNFIVAIFMKPGTSLNANEKITKEVATIVKNTDGITDVLEIGGYNVVSATVDTSSSSMFVVLEDWSKRKTKELQIDSIISNLQKNLAKVKEANIMVMQMPSIPGISAVGGFEYKLKNLQHVPLSELENMANKIIQEAIKDPRITTAYTSFNSNYPQYYLDIDRQKAYKLNINISDVFQVLQAYLGSLYVNDFNKFGKIYRVFIQADLEFRKDANSIDSFYVKNKEGKMVPLNSFITLKRVSGANVIDHFDSYQSITINGVHNSKGGYSSSDAIKAMEEISSKVLSKDFGYAWSGMALQEKEAGNTAMYIFAISLIFVFLFLSAQYESWMMPLMIMIPIPIVFLGALGANMLAGLINNTYTQIGLVLLIGMSSKNAILIIEFAKELREKGLSIQRSAIKAATLRLRAILMTVFSFLLGILPLVFATGPGALARQSLGTAVFGGMVFSTILTLFFTPLLFVLLQRLREKRDD